MWWFGGIVLVVHATRGSENSCYDWKGNEIPNGQVFVPNKEDLCYQCHCEDGFSTACSNHGGCNPPPCKFYEKVEGVCCEFRCPEAPDQPPSVLANVSVIGNTEFPGVESKPDETSPADLGLRLVASTVTSLLILALLLFMIHRLRQRRMLVMMRRLNSHSSDRHLDDVVAHVSGYDEVNIGIDFPPYEDPPPPYSPPKLPSTEAPPPYESLEDVHNNNSITERSRTQNGDIPNGTCVIARDTIDQNSLPDNRVDNSQQNGGEVERNNDVSNSNTLPLRCDCVMMRNHGTNTQDHNEIQHCGNDSFLHRGGTTPRGDMSTCSTVMPSEMNVNTTNSSTQMCATVLQQPVIKQSESMEIKRNSISPRTSFISDSLDNTRLDTSESTAGDPSSALHNNRTSLDTCASNSVSVWCDRDSPRHSVLKDETQSQLANTSPGCDNSKTSTSSAESSASSSPTDSSDRTSAFKVVETNKDQNRRSLPPSDLKLSHAGIMNAVKNYCNMSPPVSSESSSPKTVPLSVVPSNGVVRHLSPTSPSAMFSPIGTPGSHGPVGRSQSISSQMSGLSVCSETGEKRGRHNKTGDRVIQNDAPYPIHVMPNTSVKQLSQGPELNNGHSHLLNNGHRDLMNSVHGQESSENSPVLEHRAFDYIPPSRVNGSNIDEESPTLEHRASDYIPERQTTIKLDNKSPPVENIPNGNIPNGNIPNGNISNGVVPNGMISNGQTGTRNGARPKSKYDNGEPGSASRSRRRSRHKNSNKTKRKSSGAGDLAKEQTENKKDRNNVNQDMSDKILKKIYTDPNPKFKQYGFIDDPEVLSARDMTSTMNGSMEYSRGRSSERARSKSRERVRSKERTRSKSRERSSSRGRDGHGRKALSPPRQRRRHNRNTGPFSYQSLPTQGSPEHYPHARGQRSETRSHVRSPRSPEERHTHRKSKERNTVERVNSDVTMNSSPCDLENNNLSDQRVGSQVNLIVQRPEQNTMSSGRTRMHENRRSLPVIANKSYV